MTKLKICTLNTRGINEIKKRRDLFDWLRRKKIDICFLQETHSTPESESKWEAEWGYKMFFSSHSGNSRGVAILFNNSFQFQLHEKITDTEGRFIIMCLTINDRKITLMNVYGPNQDDPVFFELLKRKLETRNDDENIIIGGDFNVVQDYNLDTLNIKNKNNPKANSAVQEMKFELDLCDPWRLENPNSRMYTWHNSNNQQSRLDYFLVSSDIMNIVDSSTIKPGYRTDHSLVELHLTLSDQTRGPGLWKFNNSLLKDATYVEEIKQCIHSTIDQYRDPNSYETDLENQDFVINDEMLFDMLKLEIRGKTIAYASAKKKETGKLEKELNDKINLLYKTYLENMTTENLQKLNGAQDELKILREKRVEGIIMRAKARWHLYGERNTKYFCNLEKRHYNEKLMTKLINDDGEELTSLPDIIEEQKSFYENLYSSRCPLNNLERNKRFFPENTNMTKLTNEESLEIDNDITVEECFKVLKNMKRNKSPGSDGFTVEFYQFFWNELKIPMIRSFRESFKNNHLTNTQKLGIITCLPKPGKPKEFIKNWRPISLINVDYKIISGVIANRMKKYLDKLISNSQKGFVSGRYIGECTRLVSDLIAKMKKKNLSGILLLIDFEKAFDTLEWSFIEKTLSFFNFGENIRKWIKIFYTKIESCVLNNGHCSARFELGRGVRQGDPLSPYIFILAAEILANAIKTHDDIKGISVDNSEFLISQLADDTTLFLDGSEICFKSCMSLLDDFAKISGLSINYTKTLAVKIGMDENLTYDLGDKNIQWQTDGKFTLLGIKYDLNETDFTALNYESKIKSFEKCLNPWTSRNLTIYGKICILKSVAIPTLVHLFSSLPDPSDDQFKRLQSICFKFIWNNKPDKIKRTTLYNSYENGGFKMPDLKLFCQAQKLGWIKKLLDDENLSEWKILCLSELEKHGGNYIWLIKNKAPAFLKHFNKFWNDVFKAWQTLSSHTTNDQPLAETLFHNNNVKIDNKTIFYSDWFFHGVRYINDIVDENGNFISWEKFSETYQIINQSFKYYSVIYSIPRNWKKRIKEQGYRLNEVNHANIIKINHLKKPSKFFYSEAIENIATRPIKSEEKWNNICESEISEGDWKSLYMIPYRATIETKLRIFQMKLFHRIIPTNEFLYKCNLTNTNRCSFCSIQMEKLEHLFFECEKVKNIWLKLADTLHTTPFKMKDALLGNPSGPVGIEHIKLITKEYIYLAKIKETDPKFENLMQYIKFKMELDRVTLNENCFNKKWANLIGN